MITANDTARNAKRFLLEQKLTSRMRFLLGSRAQLEPVWRAYGIQPQTDDLEHSAYVHTKVLGRGKKPPRVSLWIDDHCLVTGSHQVAVVTKPWCDEHLEIHRVATLRQSFVVKLTCRSIDLLNDEL